MYAFYTLQAPTVPMPSTLCSTPTSTPNPLLYTHTPYSLLPLLIHLPSLPFIVIILDFSIPQSPLPRPCLLLQLFHPLPHPLRLPLNLYHLAFILFLYFGDLSFKLFHFWGLFAQKIGRIKLLGGKSIVFWLKILHGCLQFLLVLFTRY